MGCNIGSCLLVPWQPSNYGREAFRSVSRLCMVCLANAPEDGRIMCCLAPHFICKSECLEHTVNCIITGKRSQGLACGCINVGMGNMELLKLADMCHRLPEMERWIESICESLTISMLNRCSVPGCLHENWPLEADVVKSGWTCRAGHYNSSLSHTGIEQTNMELLAAKEKGRKYPRYRLCPQCIEMNVVIMCEHAGGCKRWPGKQDRGESACTHTFCFCCLREWSACSLKGQCGNPGIQQIKYQDTDQIDIVFEDHT